MSNGSSIKYKYHEVSRFIDNLCAISDGNDFLRPFKNIYPTGLELKFEYQENFLTKRINFHSL